MSYFFTIIVFFLIFSLLILVHELGHFVMAKRAGIKVEEFGFGLPPRLWGKKKGETIYSINWIPFGGFVRMYGEDNGDPKLLKSSRSFAGKSMRARILVVIAGVVMNFLLAWFLITIGFTFGMQPLLGPNDVLSAVDKGQVIVESGLKVKSVREGSLTSKLGFQSGDLIFNINGKPVDDYVMAGLKENPAGVYLVLRSNEIRSIRMDEGSVKALPEDEDLGFEFYDYASFPRVKIFDLKNHTAMYRAGLRPGDAIVSVNGSQVYNVRDYEELVRGVPTLEYKVYRNGILESFVVERSQAKQVIVSKVLPQSAAEKAGLQDGDIVVSVNGNSITESLELIKFVEEHQTEKLAYAIDRHGQKLFYEIEPVEGKIGVLLSELMSYNEEAGVSLYNADVLSSVVEIKDEKYPFYIAIYKAFGESYRLAELTAKMFTGFVGGLIKSGEVPESVAGPVGIAQMTHVFVQEGFIPLLRFVAILSLSLAVINILPFPALDGGRLLFILIELIMGRRVNPRWESWVHAFGYVLILLLILVVTYSDLARIFSS